MKFDPGDLRTAPRRYRDALLSAGIGSGGVRMLNRLDENGIEVWDVWDMRPYWNSNGREFPKCKGFAIVGEDEARRVAEDVYADRKIFVFEGRRIPLLEGRIGE